MDPLTSFPDTTAGPTPADTAPVAATPVFAPADPTPVAADPAPVAPAGATVPTLDALDQLGKDFHADFDQLKQDTQAAVDAIITQAKGRIEDFKSKVGDLLNQL